MRAARSPSVERLTRTHPTRSGATSTALRAKKARARGVNRADADPGRSTSISTRARGFDMAALLLAAAAEKKPPGYMPGGEKTKRVAQVEAAGGTRPRLCKALRSNGGAVVMPPTRRSRF